MEQTLQAPTGTRTVLVVGASGFLGQKILRELQGRPGLAIRAMSRRGAPAEPTPGIEWVQADMMDTASLDRALEGADVVVSSANGYMKESIDVDFAGNRNLIEAAVRARVGRFVFLSIVACEHAATVPHFHAKKVAEDMIKSAGLNYVFIRAPAFLDQSADYIADAVRAGRFYAVGDSTTRWSYVLTDDLAANLADAACAGSEIDNRTVDIGWREGPLSQAEVAAIITEVTGRRLKMWVVPWLVFRVMVRPVRLFSELGYDLMRMFLFFRQGRFVSDTAQQEKFFGPVPSARDAIERWAKANALL